mmetsp:Transcript_5716/g.10244  ORF Transcript_5716/g.10244 Transcript_5716/m.10244 type:complete len:235 (-) Transcript_5716:1003-1707(-)|eukprot:CAMPEP_0184520994 /NCGR_PEP_ID=MMETSP0198_2-20121128/7472_1 /TAXON_ID=1112570 /ORGANISM="Thraustochytrium sp., Strain LLF1b" /LENGTH=234 /DNA_ID=CAMNT_0026911645 /DNA_START=92 /DNA_END=796 /DNA_ORIENTATION=+
MLASSDPDPKDVLIPPENFSMVMPGIYRSGFPKRKNLPFLSNIKLRSILTLVLEEYPEINKEFNEENGIKFFQFGVPGNKEPFVDINPAIILLAVQTLLDVRNHPILVHCNKGKHRTGCLIGCLRKCCGWSLSGTLDEYIRFSHPKSRFMDQQFIELFDVNGVRLKRKYVPSWLPGVLSVSTSGTGPTTALTNTTPSNTAERDSQEHQNGNAEREKADEADELGKKPKPEGQMQ